EEEAGDERAARAIEGQGTGDHERLRREDDRGGDGVQREDARAERLLDRGVGVEDERGLVVPGLRIERAAAAHVLGDGGEDALIAVPARLVERGVAQGEGEDERERREGGEYGRIARRSRSDDAGWRAHTRLL